MFTRKILWGIKIFSGWWFFYFLWELCWGYIHKTSVFPSTFLEAIGNLILDLIAGIFLIITVIPGYIYSKLPLPKEFFNFIITLFVLVVFYLIAESNDLKKEKKKQLNESVRKTRENMIRENELKKEKEEVEARKAREKIIRENKLKKEKEEEEARIAEERRIYEEKLKKKKEIESKVKIIKDIIDNLYKETEKEVNKTLIPTLINELSSIHAGLNSDSLNEIILNGKNTDFQNIIDSLKSELLRLKNLAIEAQSKGFGNNEENFTKEDSFTMTTEKAFEIFGIDFTTDKDAIKKAFKDMAQKYHTDKWEKSPEHIKIIMGNQMKKLQAAREHLKKENLY